MPGFMQLEEPPQPAPGSAFALWQLGFRPFYLLASAFAALSIGLWALQFSGWLGRPYLQGPIWHAHEMLFGFALAVVVGFLFTAGRNWTNQPTPTGAPLAALAALWLAGRILVLTPFGWAAAVVNAAFPLAAAIALAIPVLRRRATAATTSSSRLLALMSLASLAVHLDQLGVLRFPGWVGIQVALDVVLFIIAVMGGRVIPMFTNNGVPGAGATRQPLAGEGRAGLGAGAARRRPAASRRGRAGAARDGLRAARTWRAGRCGSRGRRCARRSSGCCMPPTCGFPCTSRCAPLAALGWLAPTVATHALTVGAIGGMIIGMMTRTARGHTGRPLQADGWEVACYAMVLLAALVRVLLPLLAPALDAARRAGVGCALVGCIRSVCRALLAGAHAAPAGWAAGLKSPNGEGRWLE